MRQGPKTGTKEFGEQAKRRNEAQSGEQYVTGSRKSDSQGYPEGMRIHQGPPQTSRNAPGQKAPKPEPKEDSGFNPVLDARNSYQPGTYTEGLNLGRTQQERNERKKLQRGEAPRTKPGEY